MAKYVIDVNKFFFLIDNEIDELKSMGFTILDHISGIQLDKNKIIKQCIRMNIPEIYVDGNQGFINVDVLGEIQKIPITLVNEINQSINYRKKLSNIYIRALITDN